MTPNPYQVRLATADDIAPLTVFAIMIYQEQALQEISEAKIAAMVRRHLDRDGAIAGVIDGPAGIEASVGLAVEEFDYSDDKHLRVKWLGVHPTFRRTNHGAKLLQFAQWSQEVMGVPLYADLSTTEGLQAKLHLYLRLLPQVGAMFAFGKVPEGAFSQGHVGDDPYEARKRLKKAAPADARSPQRPQRAAA